MKPQDLMIGDWVKETDEFFRGETIFQIASVTNCMVGFFQNGSLYSAYVSKITPLPVNEEFLLKNHFEKESHDESASICGYTWTSQNHHKKISILLEKDNQNEKVSVDNQHKKISVFLKQDNQCGKMYIASKEEDQDEHNKIHISVKSFRDDNSSIVKTSIRYVHELQHILRICNINLEMKV